MPEAPADSERAQSRWEHSEDNISMMFDEDSKPYGV